MTSTSDLLRARYANKYEESGLSALASSNAVLDTLFAHRSVRAFRPEPLPPQTLEVLVAAGQSAASSSNLQVWSVVAVEDAARKERLALLAGGQQQIREAPLFLAFLVDLSRLQRLGEHTHRPVEGLHYLDTFLMGVIDAALAAQNAVTAAESLGLGTVYIGALRNHPEEVTAELALGSGVFAVFGLCVGWPDPSRPASIKPRLPQRSVLYREQYAAHAIEQDVSSYDAAMREFYAAQSLPQASWVDHSLQRLRSAADLRKRDRLLEALRGLGFQLR
jgi:nitroreductase